MSNTVESNKMTQEKSLSVFNIIWRILDDPMALTKAHQHSLLKYLVESNLELLRPWLFHSDYRPSILHKVFRNSEDIYSIEGMRFMKTLLSHSDLDHIDINSKKPEMT